MMQLIYGPNMKYLGRISGHRVWYDENEKRCYIIRSFWRHLRMRPLTTLRPIAIRLMPFLIVLCYILKKLVTQP